MNISNKGFAPMIVLIVALLAAGLGGYIYFRLQDNSIISTTTTVTDPAIITTTTILATTKDWTCGDSITFTYKGKLATYGTVESQDRCWLDRNLGASRVATSYNDSLAYGDLFQWGRLDDGHQDRNSGTTTSLSSSDNPGHSNFIYIMGSFEEIDDWRSSQNDNLWQGVSGINNPCLLGWRLPTSAEWDTERASWSSQNYNGAFASPLKLTAAGRRACCDASLLGVGSLGACWSSAVSDPGPGGVSGLFFVSSAAGMSSYDRASGFSVRCLKD